MQDEKADEERRNRLYGSGLTAHRKRHPLSSMQCHLVAAVAEFVGTFMYLFMAYSGHLMAYANIEAPNFLPSGTMTNQTVLLIALAYAISLLVTVWAFYRISGGLFNPAVTFALAISGHLSFVRAVLLIIMEILASMVAGGIVSALVPVPIEHVNTRLAPITSVAQGLFLEMFFTAELVFVVLMLAQEKSKATFIAPVGIGLAMFSAMIPGVYFTGGSLNPARSLGAAVAARSFPGYHWIYWLGPLLGACLASGYYHFVVYFRYVEVNPGQDSERPGSPEEPHHDNEGV